MGYMIQKQKVKTKESKDIQAYLNQNHKINPNKEAIIITSIYGVFGFVWIVISDKILEMMIKDFSLYSKIQMYKGWIYVILTMILIYFLILKRSRLFQNSMIKIREAHEELQATYEEFLATEDELIYQKNYTESIIENAQVVIGTWDEKGKIKSLNSYGQNLLGYSEDEVIDKNWLDLFIPNENKSSKTDVLNEIKQNKQLKNYERQLITKDKKKKNILWNRSVLSTDNNATIFVSIGIDITKQKELENKLKEMAYYDNLTNLPNRSFLEKEVDRSFNQKTPFALVFMDIDNFKYINDALGHNIGDKFLKDISCRLQKIIIKPNVVVKLNGDKYAFLLKKVNKKKEIEEELERIISHIDKTWRINNYEFFISFSLGISIYPKDGQTQTTLFRSADIAMYKAKEIAKGKYLFYSEVFLKNNIQNIEMANELQYAIDNNELNLYYQPQYNLSLGKIIGMEALLRWIHPEKGFISPVKFIPLAEETGQIYKLEKWVIRTALLQKKKFESQGFSNIDISINLSSKTLMSDINFNEIEIMISSFDVDYSKVTIEITETAIISDIEFAIERLKKLKKLGLKIALDDFGTGYSSLTHLKELPIDIVKLDRSFVNKIEENSKDSLIIKSLLNLARDLDYKVVAEGIETKEQLEYLKKYNCERGQGYLMAKALDVKDVEEMITMN